MSDELKTPWISASFGMAIISTGEVIDLGQLQGDRLKEVVHRVNCHDDLVEALDRALVELYTIDVSSKVVIDEVEEALELAKGGGT